MGSLTSDIRHAFRRLRRSPGFTAVAVATLALGIGANTAIFSVVNAVLLRPYSYPEADRIVRIYESSESGLSTVSPPNFVDWRERAESFEEMAAMNEWSYTVTGSGPATRVRSLTTTSGLFRILRASAVLGRVLQPGDEVVGQDRVVVISDALWRTRFGGDADVLDRSLVLDGEAHQIVGVMPPGFDFPGDVELWTPMAFSARTLTTQRGAHYLDVLGRLAPGTELEGARREMRTIAEQLAAAYPETNEGSSARLETLRDARVGDVRPALLVLLGAVGLVLLIACVNVANLLLTRAVGRERELAIRRALGAGRRRLIQTWVVEGTMLAVLGGIGGTLLALWVADLLPALAPEGIPRLQEARVDGAVLVFTIAISLLTGALFGLLPALQATARTDLTGALKAGGRGQSAGRERSRTRRVLVVTQMALAVMLLTGAGLLIRSFLHLRSVDPGFRPEGVVTFNVSLPSVRYPEPRDRAIFVQEILDRFESIPGVQEAGAVFGLPLTDFSYVMSLYTVDGQRVGEQEDLYTQVRIVTPGYFQAMGMEMSSGRAITERDRSGVPPVAVVNEAAARLLWPGSNPVGRSFTIGTHFGLGGPRGGGTVVGVARDVRHFGIAEEAQPEIYLAHDQFPVSFLTFAVRSRGPDPVGAIRGELRALDPEVPIYEVRSLEELVSSSLARPRFYMLLLSIFAGLALTLSAVGVYGVMAYGVAQRTREIGLRVAMGASSRDVLGLVLGQGALYALAGAGLGLAGAFAATRTLAGLLHGVQPLDPTTFLAVALLLVTIALLACLVPARRAANLDPMVALRTE